MSKYPQKEQMQSIYDTVRWNKTFAKCFRCNHEWIPRKPDIRTCAKCRSPYWDKARSIKEYKARQKLAIRLLQDFKYKGGLDTAELEKCVDCGLPARHWEHRNYGRPLMVVAVCAKCNSKRGNTDNKPN